MPKVSHERTIPEAQFDQQNPKIPVNPLKGIYPEGQGVTTNSKAKLELAAPDPQNPVDSPASTDIQDDNLDSKSDSLKLENAKVAPNSINSNKKLNDVLPESMNIDSTNMELNK